MKTLERLNDLCTAGYAMALHIQFNSPKLLFQTYPKDWREIYTQEGFVLKDPTVLWGFANAGTVNWSDLARDDPEGIMAQAAQHGLKHGFTLGIHQGGDRTIASFARNDRAFSDAEKDEAVEIATQWHENTAGLDRLTREQEDELRALSVAFTHS